MMATLMLWLVLATPPTVVAQSLSGDAIELVGPDGARRAVGRIAKYGGTADYAFDAAADCKMAAVLPLADPKMEDGSKLVIGRVDQSNAAEWKTIYKTTPGHYLLNPRLSPGGSLVAVVEGVPHREGQVLVFDVSTGQRIAQIAGRAAAWLDDSSLVAYRLDMRDKQVCYSIRELRRTEETVVVEGCGGKNLLFPSAGTPAPDSPFLVEDLTEAGEPKEARLLSSKGLKRTGVVPSIFPRPVACAEGTTFWSAGGEAMSVRREGRNDWLVQAGDICGGDEPVRFAAKSLSVSVTSIVKAQVCTPTVGK